MIFGIFGLIFSGIMFSSMAPWDTSDMTVELVDFEQRLLNPSTFFHDRIDISFVSSPNTVKIGLYSKVPRETSPFTKKEQDILDIASRSFKYFAFQAHKGTSFLVDWQTPAPVDAFIFASETSFKSWKNGGGFDDDDDNSWYKRVTSRTSGHFAVTSTSDREYYFVFENTGYSAISGSVDFTIKTKSYDSEDGLIRSCIIYPCSFDLEQSSSQVVLITALPTPGPGDNVRRVSFSYDGREITYGFTAAAVLFVLILGVCACCWCVMKDKSSAQYAPLPSATITVPQNTAPVAYQPTTTPSYGTTATPTATAPQYQVPSYTQENYARPPPFAPGSDAY